jgi:hypothetical protein
VDCVPTEIHYVTDVKGDLLDDTPINRTRAVEAGIGALPDSAVVFRYADHVAVDHFAGLLGAPRRTADVGYLGANVANSWEPLMLLAAAGGFFLFVSILTFVAVAIGTLLQNAKTESMEATFATPAESAATTPRRCSTFSVGACSHFC